MWQRIRQPNSLNIYFSGSGILCSPFCPDCKALHWPWCNTGGQRIIILYVVAEFNRSEPKIYEYYAAKVGDWQSIQHLSHELCGLSCSIACPSLSGAETAALCSWCCTDFYIRSFIQCILTVRCCVHNGLLCMMSQLWNTALPEYRTLERLFSYCIYLH